jgi:hypothetical protein
MSTGHRRHANEKRPNRPPRNVNVVVDSINTSVQNLVGRSLSGHVVFVVQPEGLIVT